MLSAVRSTIYHVLNWAGNALSAPAAIDGFNEFQLRDIGLTRDQEHIRARVGDASDPWHWPEEEDTPTKPQASPGHEPVHRPHAAAVSPRASAGENKDISISLCD